MEYERKLYGIVENKAKEKYDEILRGEFKNGINGPYHDEETDLRLSSHWILIYSSLYKNSMDAYTLEAIKILADHIISLQERNFTFNSRNKTGKDHINGTIGHAWIIEGLVEAARVLKDRRYYEVAVKCFLTHKFDYRAGVWNRIEVDGTKLGIDTTYNHQIWLAASGTILCRYEMNDDIFCQIKRFLDKAQCRLDIYDDGLIKHEMKYYSSIKGWIYEKVLNVLNNKTDGFTSMRYKEEGYHCFNVYGLAIIFSMFSKHKFFKTSKCIKAIKYCNNKDLILGLKNNDPDRDITKLAQNIKSECNIYGFSYNSPAFEIPFILKTFGYVDRDYVSTLLRTQFELTYNDTKNSFCNNTEDELTLMARSYEYFREI